jgi:hypothetical protein
MWHSAPRISPRFQFQIHQTHETSSYESHHDGDDLITRRNKVLHSSTTPNMRNACK